MMLDFIILLTLGLVAIHDTKTGLIPVWSYGVILGVTLINYFFMGTGYIITSVMLGTSLYLFFKLMPKKLWKDFGGGDAKKTICMGFFFGSMLWFYWIGLTFAISWVRSLIDKEMKMRMGIDFLISFLIVMILFM